MKTLSTYINENSNKGNIIVSNYSRSDKWTARYYNYYNIYISLKYLLEVQRHLQEGSNTDDEEQLWRMLSFETDSDYSYINKSVDGLKRPIKDNDYWKISIFEFIHTDHSPDNITEHSVRVWSNLNKNVRFSKNGQDIYNEGSLQYNVIDFKKFKEDILNNFSEVESVDLENLISSLPNYDQKYVVTENGEYCFNRVIK